MEALLEKFIQTWGQLTSADPNITENSYARSITKNALLLRRETNLAQRNTRRHNGRSQYKTRTSSNPLWARSLPLSWATVWTKS
jgi:hypothetical protein